MALTLLPHKMNRQKIIIGNWKMNTTLDGAIALANGLISKVGATKNTTVVICPPFINIPAVRDLFQGTTFKVGAQDMYTEEKGSFTGKISAEMLISHDVEYVLIGHSEVRQFSGDTDEMVNQKIKIALNQGLNPVVCVGEKLSERDSNEYKTVITNQVEKALNGLDKEMVKKLILAYEPVWAIGTGLSAMPMHANEINKLLRELLTEKYDEETAETVPTIYGGSISSANIEDFMKEGNIDGVISGTASLKADEFASIIKFIDNS